MVSRFRQWLPGLVVALLIGGAAWAAGLEPKSQSTAGRTRTVHTAPVTDISLDAALAGVSSTNGVLFACSLAIGDSTCTSTAGFAYVANNPGRLYAKVRDVSNDTTVTLCTVTFTGMTYPSGVFRTETILLGAETVSANSEYSYSHVTDVTFSACIGTDADDDLVLAVSDWIAMPVRARGAANLISICQYADGVGATDPLCKLGSALTFHAKSNSFNLETASTGFTVVDEDRYVYIVRASTW